MVYHHPSCSVFNFESSAKDTSTSSSSSECVLTLTFCSLTAASDHDDGDGLIESKVISKLFVTNKLTNRLCS